MSAIDAVQGRGDFEADLVWGEDTDALILQIQEVCRHGAWFWSHVRVVVSGAPLPASQRLGWSRVISRNPHLLAHRVQVALFAEQCRDFGYLCSRGIDLLLRRQERMTDALPRGVVATYRQSSFATCDNLTPIFARIKKTMKDMDRVAASEAEVLCLEPCLTYCGRVALFVLGGLSSPCFQLPQTPPSLPFPSLARRTCAAGHGGACTGGAAAGG